MIVYDCEIIKAVPSKKAPIIPDIEYCSGWTDFTGMGISVVCAYDSKTDRYHTFCADNLAEFQKLINKDPIIIGFNSTKFDDKLCFAHGIDVKSWDLLTALRSPGGSWKNLSLGNICETNFPNVAKTGDGALAPVEWQRGNYGKVINYCLNDVWMTKLVIDKLIIEGSITDPRNINKTITAEIPV